mmetsp:Transcript_15110/g.47458  ORF Transcript_15110/g.47458 Transcript_15110/m.47458 type:complete len:313 (-) Transcript_15110:182-1120(-)
MAQAGFVSSASLLHNNLAISPGGWTACVHNSVNVGGGKLMLYSISSGQSRAGPEVSQVTSVRYLDIGAGAVLCVSSTNGTQVYNEDASTLLFFAPITDGGEAPDVQKGHQAACFVPGLQHIVIGTSKGSLVLVHAAAADAFIAMPESAPMSPTTEISDLCFSAVTQTVFTAHSNGEIRLWAPSPQGAYSNADAIVGNGQAPVRILPMGTRLLVAYGPGTVCLFDALSRELQVEVTAHARWITGVAAREELGQVASVGEDTVLNVWNIDPSSGRVSLQHTSVVADKLLTGVAFTQAGASVAAYDSDALYQVAF